MKIECPKCNKSYNFPDEKIPVGKKIQFPCKECQELIHLYRNPDPVHEPGEEKIENREIPPSPPQQNYLQGEALKDKISKELKDLPPMPQIAFKLRRVMADDTKSFEEIGRVVECDTGISLKVIKMANSSYYRQRETVTSVKQAVIVLGFETLKEIVTLACASGFLGVTLKGYDLEAGALWRHSLAVAFASKHIASLRMPALRSDAFLSGIIHDSGKIVLDRYIHERKEMYRAFMAEEDKSILSAEKYLFRFDHSEVIENLFKKWDIPENHIIATRFHHTPEQAGNNQLALILNMADLIAMLCGFSTENEKITPKLNPKIVQLLGLKKQNIQQIMKEVVQSVESIVEEIHKP